MNVVGWFLAALVVGGGTAESEQEGRRLVEDLVIPTYQRPATLDPIAERNPWLLEVKLDDLMVIDGCNGWVARMWVPTKWAPPYLENNHHFEYWGVTQGSKHLVGKGSYFYLDQSVFVDELNRFMARACEEMRNYARTATVYLQIQLAGRMPFSAATREGPQMWRWVTDDRQVPAEWRNEIVSVASVPPDVEVDDDERIVYVGCMISSVSTTHRDVGCWSFQFYGDGRLIRVQERFRRQKGPYFRGDMP